MDLDSYVVRIYRRIFHDELAPSSVERGTLIGVVENAAGTERHKFQSIEELWVILSGRSTAGSTERTGGDGPSK